MTKKYQIFKSYKTRNIWIGGLGHNLCIRPSFTVFLKLSPQINDTEKELQLSNASEITVTLSSPSQKFWLSSQELESPGISKETVFREEIDFLLTMDGDDVQVPKEIFDRLVSKILKMCDLKAEVEKLMSSCTEKFGKRGTIVSGPSSFQKLCTEAGADKIFDLCLVQW